MKRFSDHQILFEQPKSHQISASSCLIKIENNVSRWITFVDGFGLSVALKNSSPFSFPNRQRLQPFDLASDLLGAIGSHKGYGPPPLDVDWRAAGRSTKCSA